MAGKASHCASGNKPRFDNCGGPPDSGNWVSQSSGLQDTEIQRPGKEGAGEYAQWECAKGRRRAWRRRRGNPTGPGPTHTASRSCAQALTSGDPRSANGKNRKFENSCGMQRCNDATDRTRRLFSNDNSRAPCPKASIHCKNTIPLYCLEGLCQDRSTVVSVMAGKMLAVMNETSCGQPRMGVPCVVGALVGCRGHALRVAC